MALISLSCIQRFGVCFGLLCCVAACGDQGTPIKVEGELFVKHELRTMTAQGWTVQIWLDATSYPVWYPIEATVRLTPEKWSGKKPKANLKVTLSQNKKTAREGIAEVELKECSKMPKSREVTRISGEFQNTEEFPPKEPCWQASTKDTFKSDNRNEQTKPFDVGTYSIIIEVTIDDLPPFIFEEIKVNLYDKRR